MFENSPINFSATDLYMALKQVELEWNMSDRSINTLLNTAYHLYAFEQEFRRRPTLENISKLTLFPALVEFNAGFPEWVKNITGNLEVITTKLISLGLALQHPFDKTSPTAMDHYLNALDDVIYGQKEVRVLEKLVLPEENPYAPYYKTLVHHQDSSSGSWPMAPRNPLNVSPLWSFNNTEKDHV